jgi:hypothetical protein
MSLRWSVREVQWVQKVRWVQWVVREVQWCDGCEVRNMSDGEMVLTREKREEIIRAVHAIERQLKEMEREPRWQVLYVIGTNLAIIQANVTKLPRVTPN